MDIYEYGEMIDYVCDYFDISTCRIYKLKDYGELIKIYQTNPDPIIKAEIDKGIKVIEDNIFIGYARRKREDETIQ